MICAGIRQCVDVIHLGSCQRQRGRVLHQHASAVALQNGAARNMVGVVILLFDRLRIARFIRAHLFKGGALGDGERHIGLLRQIGRPSHLPQRFRALFAAFQVVCQFHNRSFPHAIHEPVRT